jgi:hypothetical protein
MDLLARVRLGVATKRPAGQFWSFSVYDNQTRSMLETDQKLAGVDSTQPTLKNNADGSATVYFGPQAPAGHEGNCVQTDAGQGLEHPLAPLRAAPALVRPDLETRRFRAD